MKLHSVIVWMTKNSLLETGAVSEIKWKQRNSNPQPLTS